MFAFAPDSVRVFGPSGKINEVLCLSPLPGLVCQLSTPTPLLPLPCPESPCLLHFLHQTLLTPHYIMSPFLSPALTTTPKGRLVGFAVQALG